MQENKPALELKNTEKKMCQKSKLKKKNSQCTLSNTVVQDYSYLIWENGVFKPIKIYPIMLFSVESAQFAMC